MCSLTPIGHIFKVNLAQRVPSVPVHITDQPSSVSSSVVADGRSIAINATSVLYSFYYHYYCWRLEILRHWSMSSWMTCFYGVCTNVHYASVTRFTKKEMEWHRCNKRVTTACIEHFALIAMKHGWRLKLVVQRNLSFYDSRPDEHSILVKIVHAQVIIPSEHII